MARDLYQRAQQANPVDQLALYTRILELRPQDPWILFLRGVAHCKLGLLDQALGDLDLAIWLRPRFAAAITERGLALTHMGELENAMDALDEALAYDPAYAIAHENYGLAMAWLVAGRMRWPRLTWLSAWSRATWTIARPEARCFIDLGRHGEAQRDLQAYLDALPDGPKAAGVRKVLGLLPPTRRRRRRRPIRGRPTPSGASSWCSALTIRWKC
jgi:tetratricopeptide (TPR) repeat protein